MNRENEGDNVDKPFFIEEINSSAQVENKREKAREELIKKSLNIGGGRINSISTLDLEILFNLYDKYFFQNYFKENLNSKLTFSLSKRMTRAAGKTIYSKSIKNYNKNFETYEIRMGINFFLKYYEVNREKIVSGIETKDSLHAFQIVFEHEICHMIELYFFGNSSCRQARFKQIAYNIFGHKGTYHELPTNKEIASKKYGLKVGDAVTFKQNGSTYKGVIYKINTRATVMVEDKVGNYTDKKGNRYSKWYVPLSMII